jgi:hypothetical protein
MPGKDMTARTDQDNLCHNKTSSAINLSLPTTVKNH